MRPKNSSVYGKMLLVKEIKDIVRKEHGHIRFKKPIKAQVSHYGEMDTLMITDLKDNGDIVYKSVGDSGLLIPLYGSYVDNISNLYYKLLEEIILELYSEDYI